MLSVIKKYLAKNNYKNLLTDFEESYQSHPNYPSLFAITDSLSFLDIENVTLKIPNEQLIELPDLFLSFYKDDLVLVSQKLALISIETNDSKKLNLTYNDFIKDWNGIILAIEPNKNNEKLNKISFDKKYIYFSPIFLLFFLSLIVNNYNLFDYYLLTTSVLGFIFGFFIIREKLGIKNKIVSKFCNVSSSTSCSSVINSNTKNYLNFTDLPIVFFSISLLVILIHPQTSSFLIGIFSLFSLPIIAYSIILQKVKLKKWCVLCLAVSLVIIAQSVLFLIYNNLSFNLSFSAVYYLAFISILVIVLWLFIKPVFEKKQSLEKKLNNLLKLKRNFSVFDFLSTTVPEIEDFDSLKGIEYGNLSAANCLTIFVSPSCGHCHNAFKNGLDLVEKYPNKLKLKVLFNVNPDNSDNPYIKLVQNLLHLNLLNSNNAKKAIYDWHVKKIGLKAWLKKWEVSNIEMVVNNELFKQYNWCLKNNFNYTPVTIINNNQFPKEYEINEIKYFLNNFSEQKENTLETTIM